MRPARRACALVLVLALLVAVPLGAPRGCADCPPGCPMHARRDAEPEKPHHLGCHRSPSPPSGVACLRSACGRETVGVSEGLPHGILREAATVPFVPASARVPARDSRITSLALPEPPTDPPRVVA